MTDLAFLGAGVMGVPMIRNLAAEGFAVHAFNRTRSKLDGLSADGVQVFDSAATACAGCPVMVTMLADGDAVLAVANDALSGEDPPGAWIQMSTIGPEATQRCASLAEEHDVTFVDAPVLGTRTPAEQGTLVVLASGPEEARPVADPVFDAVGGRTLWLGEAGAGSAAKVMVNSWVLAIVGALAETISLAKAMNIDPDVFFDAIDGGALDVPYAQTRGRMMARERFDDVSFSLALALKDSGLVLDAAREAGIELPMQEGARERMRRAIDDGHGDEDMAATYWASAPPTRHREDQDG